MAIFLLILSWLLQLFGWLAVLFVATWLSADLFHQPPIVARHGGVLGLIGMIFLILGTALIYVAGYNFWTVVISLVVTWWLGRGFTAGARQERALVNARTAGGPEESAPGETMRDRMHEEALRVDQMTGGKGPKKE